MAGIVIAAPVRTLLSLDRDIRRSSTGAGARIVLMITAGFALVAMYVTTLTAPASARATLAGLCAAVTIALTIVAPLLAGVGDRGLAPAHVRHLPVPAVQLQRALAVASLRSGHLVFLVIGLLLAPFSLFDASLPARAVAVLLALLTALVALAVSRLALLRIDAVSRTPRGRILTAVGGTIVAAPAYSMFLLLGNVSTSFADNVVLRSVVRVLPSGWAVASGEAVDGGRWWLPVVLVVALGALGAVVARWWTAAVLDALDAAPGRVRITTKRPSAFRARGPLLTATAAEAQLLLRDPRRVGMVMMPLIFLVVGAVLMITGNDVYGLQYGAPVVIALTGTVFGNSYGLDGAAAWRALSLQHVARRVIDARMVVAGVAIGAFGVVGTVVGRVIGDPSSSTLPAAVAVVVAATLGTAASTAVQSAASPFFVTGTTAMSAMNSRGSMTGRAVLWSVGAMAATILLCLPGLFVALLVPGPAAWAGTVVALALGAGAVWAARRRAATLTASRGPEIYAAVTA